MLPVHLIKMALGLGRAAILDIAIKCKVDKGCIPVKVGAQKELMDDDDYQVYLDIG